MSISGGNGHIWVLPYSEGYDDVSLSAASVQKLLYPVVQTIFGRTHDYYKQSGRQPFWKTDKFSLVKESMESYSKTKR